MYRRPPRLANNTPTFLRDKVISYGEPPPFETLPLDPLTPLPPPPPPPPPPAPPAPLPVPNRLFHQTQMDTVQEQFQAMAIDAVEDNQSQDENEVTICLATRQSVPSPPSQRSRIATLSQKRKGLHTGQAPQDLLKLISFYLTEPLDLLRFSYTCHELYFLTATKDWYSLTTFTFLFPLGRTVRSY
ncbi:MAG: hypothetical protein J3R72DRAFT_100868 [Linnemannia gamsii]|nr:MAG: hypothetical protein J3R72DRAFT_100868 [Linnemannia gamsii]